MHETMICAVGNVATQPVYRELPSGPSARFRLAVTPRYWDREKNDWTDGHTNFFTVWANRKLAVNVQSSVSLGEPVIVQGRLKVRSEVREGQTWTSADIDAVAIGHDLARGTDAFRRGGAPEPDWETAAADAAGQDAREQQAAEQDAAEPGREPSPQQPPSAGAEAAPAPEGERARRRSLTSVT
ncbi:MULTISPECIES: single-stranded DNA-binding protein [unclassified Streptomyces]|uniref:single-stranded DNA-binding protein n=1 Tax=unclassified Streptomyces TaxID=2593676 RepID=UPI003D7254CE